VGWLRPSLCATWHGLSLAYVACFMFCLDATWHGLSLNIDAMSHGLGLTYVSHVMSKPICRHKQCHMSPSLG